MQLQFITMPVSVLKTLKQMQAAEWAALCTGAVSDHNTDLTWSKVMQSIGTLSGMELSKRTLYYHACKWQHALQRQCRMMAVCSMPAGRGLTGLGRRTIILRLQDSTNCLTYRFGFSIGSIDDPRGC